MSDKVWGQIDSVGTTPEAKLCSFPGCCNNREVSRYRVLKGGDKKPVFRKQCSKHKKFVYGRGKVSPIYFGAPEKKSKPTIKTPADALEAIQKLPKIETVASSQQYPCGHWITPGFTFCRVCQ
jgi:hypothetical protein